MKDRPYLPPLDPSQRYSIDEAAEYLRTSRVQIYKKVAAGRLRLIKDGRRSYISGADLIAPSRSPYGPQGGCGVNVRAINKGERNGSSG